MTKHFTRVTLDFGWDDADSASFTLYLMSLIEQVEDDVRYDGLLQLISCTTTKLGLIPTGDTIPFTTISPRHLTTTPAEYGDAEEPTDELTDDIA